MLTRIRCSTGSISLSTPSIILTLSLSPALCRVSAVRHLTGSQCLSSPSILREAPESVTSQRITTSSSMRILMTMSARNLPRLSSTISSLMRMERSMAPCWLRIHPLRGDVSKSWLSSTPNTPISLGPSVTSQQTL